MEQRRSAFECYERGLVLKQVKIYDTALKEFRQAAMDPQYAGKAYAQMALCFRSTGRAEQAVAAFRQALKTATFSPKERVHILYLLGQTLESLGRHAETLEAYRWLRREDANFMDVAHRIQHLSSGARGPVPKRLPAYRRWLGDLLHVCGELTIHTLSLVSQRVTSLGRYAETLDASRFIRRETPGLRHMPCLTTHHEPTPMRRSPPASRDRQMDKRRHTRVAVQMRSQFSSKGRTVAGEGELRDLSPWGCRMTSSVPVPVGADLECCIFPQDADNPFVIEGATVRWISPREFGLSFTNVRPGVQRQIAQLCRTRTLVA
jgi:tetratricopeptide (TPR) repeat protein